DSGRRIFPILKIRLPAEVGRGKLWDGVRRLGPRCAHGNRHHRQVARKTTGQKSNATSRRGSAFRPQSEHHFLLEWSCLIAREKSLPITAASWPQSAVHASSERLRAG